MTAVSSRRVVITGMGVISPLGNALEKFWSGIQLGRCGIQSLADAEGDASPLRFAGLASDFTESIDNFGRLDAGTKKAIRKGLKLMCREIKMGVAAAQLALQHSTLDLSTRDPDRMGVVFGCDHIVTEPEELADAYRASVKADDFGLQAWGQTGIAQITPLWLLKYLPNMPASHVAIYNDLRGPSNSLTFREPSSNLAVGEASATIQRGMADCMLAGATGSSVGPLRSLHAAGYLELANNGQLAASVCRPFDLQRQGAVVGEGAAAVLLEERELALARGATIFGEVHGYGSSVVLREGRPDIGQAVGNAARLALRASRITPAQVGHVHAHGVGTQHADREEARAIGEIFTGTAARVPVTAAKSYFGNLGAAGGLVELIAEPTGHARRPFVSDPELRDPGSGVSHPPCPGSRAAERWLGAESQFRAQWSGKCPGRIQSWFTGRRLRSPTPVACRRHVEEILFSCRWWRAPFSAALYLVAASSDGGSRVRENLSPC